MELAIVVILYFVPSVIAGLRRHRSAGAIFVTNLLLGWTLAGWLFALIWAFTSNTERRAREDREDWAYEMERMRRSGR